MAVKVILGLGNPGPRYERTRHNAGFRVVERIAAEGGERFAPNRNTRALMARMDLWNRRVLLAKPQTFMNLSGQAAQALVHYYRIALADLLVVVDDVNLPVGTLRVRPGGSAGGHNGMKDIIRHLGEEFARLRVGVGDKQHPAQDLADHVLGTFAADEEAAMDKVVPAAAEACRVWVEEGLEACRDRFNGPVEQA